MATSTIRLYKINFPNDTNCYIDDIESYLSLLTYAEVNNVQYMKNDLDLSLKLVLQQKQVNEQDYNYCRIVNSDETSNKYYYFIVKRDWTSESVVKLQLRMDTINTLGQSATSKCNPRNFTSNTFIKRQHMDRVKKPTSYDKTNPINLARIVDKESEGIVVNKYKSNEDKLIETSASGGAEPVDVDYNWYLIYEEVQSGEDEGKINTYLCADHSLRVNQSGGESKTFTADDFEEGKYYYVTAADNEGFTFDITSEGTLINKAVTYTSNIILTVDSRKVNGLAFKKSAGNLYYSIIFDNKPFINYNGGVINPTCYGNNHVDEVADMISTTGTTWTQISSTTCTKLNYFRVSTTDYITGTNPQTDEGIISLVKQTLNEFIGPNSAFITNTIDDLDRYDKKYQKIIKLPYCPISALFINNPSPVGLVFIIFDYVNWHFSNGLIKYIGTGLPQLESSFGYGIDNEVKIDLSASNIKINASKNKDLESKLYHSDFHDLKLVYDSFTTIVKPENINVDKDFNPDYTQLRIDFKPTSTMNSKLGFKFSLDEEHLGTYEEEEDFPLLILSSRNNEEVLFNSSYLNYIQTGFNYDKKSNALAMQQAQRQATNQQIGTAVSLAGTAVSTAMNPIGLINAPQTISNAVMNWSNAEYNVKHLTETQELSMQAKLASLAAQGVSIAGCDDIDLMSWYSDNRLWIMRYDARDNIKNNLYRIFDYTGYSHTIYATPNVDSRIWYNYLQCNPAIEYEGVKQYHQSWIDDLKAKYNDGVTIFHKIVKDDRPNWNIERLFENYETWLLQ